MLSLITSIQKIPSSKDKKERGHCLQWYLQKNNCLIIRRNFGKVWLIEFPTNIIKSVFMF